MIGLGGLKEKGINLEISLRLKEVLEKNGFTVVMTREKDKGLNDENASNKKAQDMQRRIAFLNGENPCLLYTSTLRSVFISRASLWISVQDRIL